MTSSFLTQKQLLNIGFANVGHGAEISTTARFYRPHLLSIGNNVRIDDFSVLSVAEESSIGHWVHIGVNVFITSRQGISIGNFSGLSSGVRVFGSSDDFTYAAFTHPSVPENYRSKVDSRIIMEGFNQVGANSVLIPGAYMELGSVLGALSLLKSRAPSWKVLAGIPSRVLFERENAYDLIALSKKLM